MTAERKTPSLRKTLMMGACLTALLCAAPLAAQAEAPKWQPKAAERLVKLPSTYLNKAIEQDFAGSDLAAAIGDLGGKIEGKARTLDDLRNASERAEGEVRTELTHQLLAEKQAYVKMMGERLDYKRRQLRIKVRLYERILDRVRHDQSPASGQRAVLIEDQKAARARFETVADEVDMAVFAEASATESKYSREYSSNRAALDKLADAVRGHRMNAQPEIDGRAVTKEEHLRQMIATAESELSLVDQEESILAYMAKLVALDAMALSEGLDEMEFAGDVDGPKPLSVATAVNHFIGH